MRQTTNAPENDRAPSGPGSTSFHGSGVQPAIVQRKRQMTNRARQGSVLQARRAVRSDLRSSGVEFMSVKTMPSDALSSIVGLLGPLPIAGFLGSFGWTFFVVFLPFKVQGLADQSSALLWTGWIMVAAPIFNILSNPVWAGLPSACTESPYVAVQTCQALTGVFMAFSGSPFELLLARIAQGLLGSVSTYLFLMAGRGSDGRANVAKVQSAASIALFSGSCLGRACGSIFRD